MFSWRLIIKIKSSEYFSFYSHLTGAVAALVGLVLLLIKVSNHSDLILISVIYGLAMCGMFSLSAIYHATKRSENSVNIWRKLDHIAIFFMIAGSYTPICYIYLSGAWRWSIILIAWGFVIAGIILKVFFIGSLRVLSTILYLLLGWLAIFPLHELWRNMPRIEFFLLLGGGIVYSIGALLYAIKKPNPKPGIFGFHEIFHLLILAGAILHYIAISMALNIA
ncbi:MAG: hemolysin III family protein [Dehalococcoidia bacterium]|nr:hemolysin III family protein [Dehalococcoidia bacterium]